MKTKSNHGGKKARERNARKWLISAPGITDFFAPTRSEALDIKRRLKDTGYIHVDVTRNSSVGNPA